VKILSNAVFYCFIEKSIKSGENVSQTWKIREISGNSLATLPQGKSKRLDWGRGTLARNVSERSFGRRIHFYFHVRSTNGSTVLEYRQNF